MGKDITFENKPTVKNSMQFYKEYFNRMGNAYATKNRLEQEFKNKPITGREKEQTKVAIKKLNKLASEYGLDPIK